MEHGPLANSLHAPSPVQMVPSFPMPTSLYWIHLFHLTFNVSSPSIRLSWSPSFLAGSILALVLWCYFQASAVCRQSKLIQPHFFLLHICLPCHTFLLISFIVQWEFGGTYIKTISLVDDFGLFSSRFLFFVRRTEMSITQLGRIRSENEISQFIVQPLIGILKLVP